MIKIPKDKEKVKVGPFTYTIDYSHEVTDAQDAYGSVNNRTQKIFLDPDNTEERQRECLLHEIIHVCMHVSGLSYRFNEKEEIKRPDEEDVTRELGVTLIQAIQDNPNIFGR